MCISGRSASATATPRMPSTSGLSLPSESSPRLLRRTEHPRTSRSRSRPSGSSDRTAQPRRTCGCGSGRFYLDFSNLRSPLLAFPASESSKILYIPPLSASRRNNNHHSPTTYTLQFIVMLKDPTSRAVSWFVHAADENWSHVREKYRPNPGRKDLNFTRRARGSFFLLAEEIQAAQGDPRLGFLHEQVTFSFINSIHLCNNHLPFPRALHGQVGRGHDHARAALRGGEEPGRLAPGEGGRSRGGSPAAALARVFRAGGWDGDGRRLPSDGACLSKAFITRLSFTHLFVQGTSSTVVEVASCARGQ